MKGREREHLVDWTLTFETPNLDPASDVGHLRELKRVRESFDRLVVARRITVRCLMKVGNDVKVLDEKIRKQKIGTRCVSIGGKHLKDQDLNLK